MSRALRRDRNLEEHDAQPAGHPAGLRIRRRTDCARALSPRRSALIALGAAASRQVHVLRSPSTASRTWRPPSSVSAAVGMVDAGWGGPDDPPRLPPRQRPRRGPGGQPLWPLRRRNRQVPARRDGPLTGPPRRSQSEPIPAHTDRTVTEPESLWAEIEAVPGTGLGGKHWRVQRATLPSRRRSTTRTAPRRRCCSRSTSRSDASRERVPALGEALRREARLIAEHAGGVPHGAAGTSPNAAQPNTEGALNEQLA